MSVHASVSKATAALGSELATHLQTAGYPQAAAAAEEQAVADALAQVSLRLRELLERHGPPETTPGG